MSEDKDFQAASEIGKIYNSFVEKNLLCEFFLDSALVFVKASRGYLFLAGTEDKLWLECTSDGQKAVGSELQQNAQAAYQQGKPVHKPLFLFVPLIVGFLVAFLLRPDEFLIFLGLLFIYEGRHCALAVYDFYLPRGEWLPILKFFLPFYSSYLLFLILVIRQAYYFTRPFVERGDLSNLAVAVENVVAQILIIGVLVAVITNLLAHWIINKDAIRPSVYTDEWEGDEEADPK